MQSKTTQNRINPFLKKAIAIFMTFVFAISLFSVEGIVVSAATLKSPTIKSASAESSSSIKIKWKKVSGAKGYAIYQKKGSGSFEKLATITSGSKTSYTAKDLSSATKYTYKIKSYKKNGGKKVYSSYSENKVAYTKISAPKITSAKAISTTSIKLSWKKVSRADGYVIYRKSSDSYTRVAVVKSSKSSYTIKKLKSNKKYTYVIRAYFKAGSKNSYSAKSKAVSVKTLHKHTYEDYVCTICGKIDKSHAYEYLKAWLLEHGEVSGAFVGISEMYDDEMFSLKYSAQDDSVYISDSYYNSYGDFRFTKLDLDDFEYFSSIGENVYDDYVEGKIKAKTFTPKTPLTYIDYNDTNYTFVSQVESTQVNICFMLDCLSEFFENYDVGIDLYDLGFESY